MWIALIVGYCLSKSCSTFTTVPGHSVLNFSRYFMVENMSALEGNNVAHLFWQSLFEYGRELCTVQFRCSKVLSSCAISSKRIGFTWLLRLINTCTFSGLQTWPCFLRMLNTSLNWVDAFQAHQYHCRPSEVHVGIESTTLNSQCYSRLRYGTMEARMREVVRRVWCIVRLLSRADDVLGS